MNSTGLKPIAHKQRVDFPIQTLDANPDGKRQRLELSRRCQANPVADALKFQSSLFRPAAFGPLTADDGRLRQVSRRFSKVAKLPARRRHVLEIEMNDQ